MRAIYRQFVKFTLATVLAGCTLAPPVFAAEIHKVQAGETLWSIARQYNTDVDTLARINGLKDITKITEGMDLKVSEDNSAPTVSSTVNASSQVQIYKIGEGETLWSIARRFGVDYQKLVDYNNLSDPNKINAGMEIKIPPAGFDGTVATVATVANTSTNAEAHSSFIWPLKGKITSPFGARWGTVHEGIDISVPIGTNVAAASSGRVITAGWINGYGYAVILEHTPGLRTLYGHLSRLLVKAGDTVTQGQLIALSGNSGRSTGPHLHFEVQKAGEPVDPMNFLP